MFEFFLKGGFLMWPIFLCSVISIAIILERFYHLHKEKIDISEFFSQIKGLLMNGKRDEALTVCRQRGGASGRVLSVGIQNHRRHLQHQEKAVSRIGSSEVRNLEKHLKGLAVIGNITPLLGLLGTVTGMIKVFIKIQELGGSADTSVLAGGIWEALLTTAAGLSVAIPTVVFYHYFEARVDNIAMQMKDAAQELLELFGAKEDGHYGI